MLYHFQIELSDVDREIYESLDFRIVQHPSETPAYLLTRALAFALSYREGLAFSPSGLGTPEVATIQAMGKMGDIDLWIEIGNPSARKLHRAGKAANQVIIYTYKSVEVLLKEIKSNGVYRAKDIQIYALDSNFLTELEDQLKKNNRWSLLIQHGQLDLGTGKSNFTTELTKHRV